MSECTDSTILSVPPEKTEEKSETVSDLPQPSESPQPAVIEPNYPVFNIGDSVTCADYPMETFTVIEICGDQARCESGYGFT